MTVPLWPALREAADRVDALVAALPEPGSRLPEERTEIAAAKDTARALRTRYLQTHADAVYDRLTGGGLDELRLAELVEAAAAEFPALVPTAGQLAADGGRPQADKEGYEIDQGIFLRAVLNSPRVSTSRACTPATFRWSASSCAANSAISTSLSGEYVARTRPGTPARSKSRGSRPSRRSPSAAAPNCCSSSITYWPRRTRISAGPPHARASCPGRRIRATEPDARLLIDEVVESEEIDAAVAGAVERLGGPAVVPNRRMLNTAMEPVEEFRRYMAEFALQQALRLYGEDVIGKVGRFASRAA